jgi:hypothetical protein
MTMVILPLGWIGDPSTSSGTSEIKMKALRYVVGNGDACGCCINLGHRCGSPLCVKGLGEKPSPVLWNGQRVAWYHSSGRRCGAQLAADCSMSAYSDMPLS